MLVRQASKQASTVSHRPTFKLHWMLISVHFPLQLCIDPNCVCPEARILGRQLIFIWRHQDQRNQLFSRDLQQGICGFPQEQLCRVTTKTGAEKP